MIRNLRLMIFVVACGSVAGAQAGAPESPRLGQDDALTIVNRNKLEVPEERARILLLTTWRVLAEEFHRRPEETSVKVKLVLGEPSERVGVGNHGEMIVYLEHWSETQFVQGLITGTIQRFTPVGLRKQMLAEIVRRTDKLAPVSVKQLRIERPTPVMQREGNSADCMSAWSSSPCLWPNRPVYP